MPLSFAAGADVQCARAEWKHVFGGKKISEDNRRLVSMDVLMVSFRRHLKEHLPVPDVFSLCPELCGGARVLWIRRGLTERRRRSAHVFRTPLVLSQAQFLTFRTNVHYNEAILVALMGHSLVRALVLDAVLFRASSEGVKGKLFSSCTPAGRCCP